MKTHNINLLTALAAGILIVIVQAPPIRANRLLLLNDAISLALEKNEEIFVSRQSAESADAALFGAKAAFNPVFALESGYQRLREPAYLGYNNRSIAADETQRIEGVAATASISQYLPTGASLALKATTSRGTSTNSLEPLSPAYQARLGFEFRQPLLKDLSSDRERLAIRVAETDKQRSNAELRYVTTEIVSTVEKAYWNLAAAVAEVEVREESVRLAEEQLAETKEKVSTGAAPETETAQPLAELERRRGELLASKEAASRAQTALKTLILSDSDAGIWEQDFTTVDDKEIAVSTYSRGESMENALKSRPEIEMAKASVDGRKAELSFANNSLWPSLDAVLSYERFGITGRSNPALGAPVSGSSDIYGEWGNAWDRVFDSDFDDIRAGFVFSFPIGNDQAEASKDIAEYADSQAEALLERTRKSVRADVLNALAALETAGQRIETARAGREAAEIQLSSEQDRYEIGLSTNFLVLTRQNDLSRARLDEISARADYRISKTEYARATSELLDQHQIVID